MKRSTRSKTKAQESNRSSTPVPFEDSQSNTTAFLGFSGSESDTIVETESDISELVGKSAELSIIVRDKMPDENEEQDQAQGAAALEPIISQQIQTEMASLEERLLSRLSTMLESQRLSIPNFPQDLPPISRHSRGRGRHRHRNSGNFGNRGSNYRASNNRLNVQQPAGSVSENLEHEVELPPIDRRSSQIEDLMRNVQLNDSDRNDFKRLEMHRWNISFSGDGTGLRIDEFIVRVEHIAISQRYSLEEVARNIYILLKGLAASWFFGWLSRNPNPSWTELRSQLRDHFRTADTDCDIEHTIMNRAQRSNETFDQFYHVITELNSRMENRRSDADLIEILKRNVNPKMTVFIHNSKTRILSEFLIECRRAERDIAKVEGSMNRNRPRVNELNLVDEIITPDAEDLPQVDAIYSNVKREGPDHSKLKCFDCKKIGHIAINCQEKSNRIFCYRCGKDNYVVSNCVDCNGKNGRQSWVSGIPDS